MKTMAGLLLAIIAPVAVFAQTPAHDYSKLYEAVSPAVVQIVTDDGSGSGFLVTPFGHIATNYHVVRGARYLAVQFPDGKKVKAVVAAVNPNYDMAVLKVNSEVVHGIQPLRVLPEEREETLKVGIPVVAIGSPLNQKFLMTQGILSKVDDTIILGDFLLQAGNSGGPLMNMDGDVVAINTFGEGSLSGSIRITALRAYLSSPELLAESIGTEPSPDQLRSISAVRYPIETLNRKIESEPLDPEAYRFKAGDFTVTAITPVLIAKLQASQEKRRSSNRQPKRGDASPNSGESGPDPYYEWHRSTETALDFAVTFDIRPDASPTKGLVPRIIPPMLRLGKTGKTEMQFKGEFLEFRIYRDGKLVEPIMPGRQMIAGDAEENHHFSERSYAGNYVYSPLEFMTGNEFRIQVYDTSNPNAFHKEVVFASDSKFIKQIRADFTVVPGVLISQAP